MVETNPLGPEAKIHRMSRFKLPWVQTAAFSLAAGVALLLASPAPQAEAITLTMLEVGNDVVISGSGSVNLTALNGPITIPNNTGAFVYPIASSFLLGSLGGIDVYFGDPNTGDISFPADFGPGTGVLGDGTGDPFGPVQYIFGFGPELWVPAGYQSGAPINASAFFGGESLATLGITPGVYVWSWGSGADADSLTLNVESPIPPGPPVPGPLPLLGAGAAMGWSRRLRKRSLQARR